MARTARRVLQSVLMACLAACAGAPTSEGGSSTGLPAVEVFSATRAWTDLEALVDLGPRPPGSAASEAARRHIRDAVEQRGVEAEVVETEIELGDRGSVTLHHVVATVPGDSSDRFVLVAPYDSGRYPGVDFVGANEGASGAALLLELMRVLSQRELSYTLVFVWLDGEGRLALDERASVGVRWLGSHSLALRWAEEGELEPIRLLVAFDRVCDADLRIARDLNSYRWHRDEFWKTAERLGRTAAFPPHSAFETVAASHRAFQKNGVRPVVAIVDTAFGGDEAPGLYAEGAQDSLEHCAPESLETVGVVTVETIETIARRLAKIDRFTRSPSTATEASP